MIRARYILLFLTVAMLCSLSATALAHGPERELPRWADELTDEQRTEAKRIIEEAAPRLRALRSEMRSKMRELKSFAYSKAEDHEGLPRLGRELQALREELRREVQALDERLLQEVGVSVKFYKGRSCVSLAQRPSHTENDTHEGEAPQKE